MTHNHYPENHPRMGVFSGDSRIVVQPTNKPEMTKPIPIRRGAARLIISDFLAHGKSIHSGRGGYAWVIVEFCKENGFHVEVDIHGKSVQLGDGQELETPTGFEVRLK